MEKGTSVPSRSSQQGVKRAMSGSSAVPATAIPSGAAYDPMSEKQSAINLLRQLSHPQDPDQPQQVGVEGRKGARICGRERKSGGGGGWRNFISVLLSCLCL